MINRMIRREGLRPYKIAALDRSKRSVPEQPEARI